MAFYNQEELKSENEALRKENETLRGEVDALRAENDALRSENENIRLDAAEVEAQFHDETQRWNTKEAELQRRMGKTDRAILAENETLRAELLRVREEHDEDTQHWTRKEAELRKASDKKVKAEHAKLQSQNDELKAQLAEAKARREAEIRRWNSKEAEMRSKIERRDETIRQFEEMTQEEVNETLRQHNEDLRVELARFKAQRETESQQGRNKEAELREQLAQVVAEREQETQQWSKKEGVLRGKIERREEALRDMQDMTREVLTSRNADSRNASQRLRSDLKQVEAVSKPKKSTRHEQSDSRTKTSSKVEEEAGTSWQASSTRITSRPSNEKKLQDASVSQSGSSRFQPERPSVPAPKKLSRRSSAPNIAPAQDGHSASDNESTTDLDLRNNDRPDRRTGKATAVVDFAASTEPPAMELTYLSFMDGDEIAKLRKALEEERAAARKRAAMASPPQQRQTDTTGPVASTSATRPQSLPRKSSLKDVTGGLKSDDATKTVEPLDTTDDHTDHPNIDLTQSGTEERQPKQDTSHSILSNSSRRRSTAPIEMTSAFILPDITIHQRVLSSDAQAAVSDLSPHDAKNCTVCRRTTCNGDHNCSPVQLDTDATATAPPLTIPTPVPVSSRPAADDDIDATLRPAQPPATALATVLKELEDELAHLKLELARQEAALRAHDPALGKRRRKGVQLRIRELVRVIDLRADQIYALYDVLEGQKEEGRAAVDVGDTLQSLGIEIREEGGGKGRGKRVVIESVGGSEGEESGAESGEEELPWEGISDAESVASGRVDRRRSVEC